MSTATAQETSNKEAFGRMHHAANSGDPALVAKTIDELFAPDAEIDTPPPVDGTVADQMKEVWTRLLRAYPDLHITVEDLIAKDDKIVCRQTVTATHLGEYMGLPPTGRAVTYNEMFILKFVDGQIAEIWGVVDVFSQMKQLGAIA